MTNLLSVSDLSVRYIVGGRTRHAVDKASLNIPSTGHTIGIVGESGSGKTTLGLSLMNLIEPPGNIESGQIFFMDKNVLSMNSEELRKFRWHEVAMVYQSAMNSLNPVKSITSHIVEVLREHTDISKGEARERAIKLLSDVGIKPERADAYSHELSGGMRQRAVIAMALALSPKLLIADEPTSALDVVVQKQILLLLKKQVSEARLSLFFITHEIALLGDLVEFVVVMFAGEIVERGALKKVLFEPLHPYTQMLIGSLLTLDSTREVLGRSAAKDSMVIPEVGCKFAARCKYVFARCRVERPLLMEVDSGRFVSCHKYST